MEEKIGVVTHVFSKISVAVFKLTDGEIKIGDTIRVKGATTDYEQPVDSMQVNHQEVSEAKVGDEVGVKTTEPVRKHDEVFKKSADGQ